MVVVIAVAYFFKNHWSLLHVTSKSKGVFIFCTVCSLFNVITLFLVRNFCILKASSYCK